MVAMQELLHGILRTAMEIVHRVIDLGKLSIHMYLRIQQEQDALIMSV